MNISNLDKLVQSNAAAADAAVALIADESKRAKAWEVVFGSLCSIEIQIAVQSHLANQASVLAVPGHRGPMPA